MTKNKLIILFGVLGGVCIFVMLLILAILLVSGSISNSNQGGTTTPTPTGTPTVTLIPTATTERINTLYWCSYKDRDVLFIHNGSDRNFEIVQYVDKPAEEITEEVMFTDLINCRELYAGKNREVIYPGEAVFNSTRTKIWFSLARDLTNNYQYPDNTVLFEMDLISGNKEEKFSNQLFEKFETGQATGAFGPVALLNDSYLVVRHTQCYGCGAATGFDYYVLNTATGQYKFVAQDIGGFEIEEGKLTYNALIKTGEEPNCVADDCNIYKPEGAAGSVLLP